ncbi:MAG: protease inhibitor I42 family protein [Chloroflexota bacterium]|nr:protease inhibitor I42 family protein [Chloroflexota bacterium]
MKSKLVPICVIIAISLCLFGCSSAPKSVSVDASYDGKEVELGVGDSLLVTLESNSTTGFSWELAKISDETVLKQIHQKYEGPGSGAPPGAGGQEVWTFKAFKDGTSSISMEYSRPWEGGEKAAETFNLTVIVK